MKILIVSDSHRYIDNLVKVLKKEEYDAVIHLGDSEGHAWEIERELNALHPLCPLKFVRGNCDNDISIEPEVTAKYAGVKIFMCHGHRYSVNAGRKTLALKARETGAQIALYGHTHKPDLEEIGGIRVFNPGSISEPRQYPPRPSYGILEIGPEKEIRFEHRFL